MFPPPHNARKLTLMPVRILTDIMTRMFRKEKTLPFGCGTAGTVSPEAPLIDTWSLYQSLRWLRRSQEPAFFVRSAEVVPCPCCGGELSVVGSRPRAWYKGCGERAKLIVRRLHCAPCARIHHELPSLLVPYKRYDAESIEGVLSEPECNDVAADESTIRRWKSWFHAWIVYAVGILQSLSIRFHLPVENSSASSQSALQSLGRFVGDAAGWLSRAVRPMANSNVWATDPFCISVRASLK